MCAYSEADGSERRRAARSRAVGVRPELFAEPAELLEELVAREEPPREEPGGTLRRVPRAEVLDDGLRMHAAPRDPARTRAWSGDLPSPLGGRAKLGEDLLVGVATAHARAKRGELCLVDAHGRTLV